jgi:Skp family chaperone for outer membrane proteins
MSGLALQRRAGSLTSTRPSLTARGIAASLLLASSLGCAEEPRVGVVDVEQAFQRSPLAMVAALQLKKELASDERDLKRRGRELAELRQQLEHGGLELEAEQRARLEQRLAVETAGLVERQRRYREDLAAAQKRQGEEMIARVEEVAKVVASERGLALLLEKESVLYTVEGDRAEPPDAERVDLTEPVIRALLDRINPTEIPKPSED